MLKYPFRIGQFFKDMKTYGAKFTIDRTEFLSKLVAAADQIYAGQYNQNGYWADHWTYTLDLVVCLFIQNHILGLYKSTRLSVIG